MKYSPSPASSCPPLGQRPSRPPTPPRRQTVPALASRSALRAAASRRPAVASVWAWRLAPQTSAWGPWPHTQARAGQRITRLREAVPVSESSCPHVLYLPGTLRKVVRPGHDSRTQPHPRPASDTSRESFTRRRGREPNIGFSTRMRPAPRAGVSSNADASVRGAFRRCQGGHYGKVALHSPRMGWRSKTDIRPVQPCAGDR